MIVDAFRWALATCVEPVKEVRKEHDYQFFIKNLVILAFVPAILLALAVSAVSYFLAPMMLDSVMGGTGMLAAAGAAAGVFFGYIIAALVGPFIIAAIVHSFGKFVLKLMKQNFIKTYNAVAYASVPVFLFGWIPMIGQLTGGWSVVIGMYALASHQKISNMRAIIAIFVPLIIVGLIAFAVYGSALFSSFGRMPM